MMRDVTDEQETPSHLKRRKPKLIERPAPEQVLPALEAVLFVADQPTELGVLARSLNISRDEVTRAVDELAGECRERGVRIQRTGELVQLASAPETAAYVERFLGMEHSAAHRRLARDAGDHRLPSADHARRHRSGARRRLRRPDPHAHRRVNSSKRSAGRRSSDGRHSSARRCASSSTSGSRSPTTCRRCPWPRGHRRAAKRRQSERRRGPLLVGHTDVRLLEGQAPGRAQRHRSASATSSRCQSQRLRTRTTTSARRSASPSSRTTPALRARAAGDHRVRRVSRLDAEVMDIETEVVPFGD